MVLFYFFLVFVYSIQSIYYANILYYVVFIRGIIADKGRIRLINNTIAKLFLFSFILWVTISTAIYAIQTNHIDFRGVIQYVFTLQYLVLIISTNQNYNSFKRWLYRFSILLSTAIIAVAIYIMIATKVFNLNILYNNTMAYKHFPGWPNTVPVPLLIALLISFANKKPFYSKIILISGLVLTTSRGAYLGTIIIVCYYAIYKIKLNKKMSVYLILGLITSFLLGLVWLFKNQEVATRLLRSYDRVDIFKTTVEYIKLNPVLGYGGNTIDQLQNIAIDHIPIRNWGHTHNWVLEICLRYGIVGIVLFVGVLVSLWWNINNKERKFIFAVLVFLALFQTFMRDFVFIFYLSYLASNVDENLVINRNDLILLHDENV